MLISIQYLEDVAIWNFTDRAWYQIPSVPLAGLILCVMNFFLPKNYTENRYIHLVVLVPNFWDPVYTGNMTPFLIACISYPFNKPFQLRTKLAEYCFRWQIIFQEIKAAMAVPITLRKSIMELASIAGLMRSRIAKFTEQNLIIYKRGIIHAHTADDVFVDYILSLNKFRGFTK